MSIPLAAQCTADVLTKKKIQAAGGTTLHRAIAMLEDEHLSADPTHHPHYRFGDQEPPPAGSPPGMPWKPKTGDAANFGIFKMNWFMIKQCAPAQRLIGAGGRAQLPSVWQNAGRSINNDATLATQILLDAMTRWSTAAPVTPGPGNFWAGHRWGESGLINDPKTNWAQILDYYNAVQAIDAACRNPATVNHKNAIACKPASPLDVWNTMIRYGRYVTPI